MAKQVVLTLDEYKAICAVVREHGRNAAFERFPTFSPATIGAIACAGGVTKSHAKIVERDRVRVAAMLERSGAKLPGMPVKKTARKPAAKKAAAKKP
jgi:hypothetical protein